MPPSKVKTADKDSHSAASSESLEGPATPSTGTGSKSRKNGSEDPVDKFRPGMAVFGAFKTKDLGGLDRRWYQAKIIRYEKKLKKFSIEWFEDHQKCLLAPSEIKLPKEVLQTGMIVNIIKKGDNLYDDVMLDECRPDGNHVYRRQTTLEIIPDTDDIESLMIRQKDLAAFEKKYKKRVYESSSSDVASPEKQKKSRVEEKEQGQEKPKDEGEKAEVVVPALPVASKRTTNNSLWNATSADMPVPPELLSSPRRQNGSISEDEPQDGYRQLLYGWAFLFSAGSANVQTFNRKVLGDLIRKMGGQVVNTFEQLHEFAGNPALLSPSWCRTTKYFQCLASGVPCISHDWIMKLSTERQWCPFEGYRLAAGSSTPSEVVIPWSPNIVGVLQGCVFGFFSVTEVESVWKPVLVAADAVAVVLTAADFSSFDPDASHLGNPPCSIVVLEDKFPRDLIARCRKLGINVVITEWILESLIRGERQACLTSEQLNSAVAAVASSPTKSLPVAMDKSRS